MRILVLNSGSSSQKACLYEIGETLPKHPPACLWEGRIEWGGETAAIAVKNLKGIVQKEQVAVASREQAIRHLLSTLVSGEARAIASASDIDVVGHRVVHGGPHFEDPVVITPEVRSAIDSMSEFAPLHIRAELEGMKIVENLRAALLQVAVFDTGFHCQMPLSAAIYPGPYEWFEGGIRRYGFHGINHQYCAQRATQLLGKYQKPLKLVTCHLGNGCSVAAIQGSRSVDTTMGFTPLDGLMMGTRSGSVDPGILTFLMRQGQLNSQEIDKVLNEKSGLLGISGVSSDMRQILAGIKQGHKRAKLAFDIYVHRLRAAIGGMAAVLGGMDALVFTAGVGENSPEVRAEACSSLEFLGLRLDSEMNARPSLDQDISTADSRVRVLVIRAEEDWAIAAECWKLAHAATPVGTRN
ncbi:acetate/propionate family kinase [Edaphobacter aggregans]|uniref:acetate/propionate family kinase n=1 Tax=Edaphobacter aggregans TaxID=570835 RepID=UPI00055395E0|nr:acetate kinase [Edaphobacter aggregans]